MNGPLLQRPVIGGQRVSCTDNAFGVLDPATGRAIATVSRGGAADIDLAVASARVAFEKDWRHRNAADRARACRRMADVLRGEREQLAALESLDTGKPLSQARTDADAAARYFEFYAGCIEGLHGAVIESTDEALTYTVLEPHGVCGHIIPWNYPLQVACRTLAPALAAGNCCVLKPAEDAPLSALRLAELAEVAGLPAGALNVVPGLGEEAGAALAAHPGIDHLAFTGSREVGRQVMAAAAANVIPVTLELGGKSPQLVFHDSNLKAAADAVAAGITEHAGQNCSAGSRLLIHESVHDEFVSRLVARFEGMTLGRGRDDPDIGPLISAVQRDRVLRYCALGRDEGDLLTGGTAPRLDADLANGYFVTPAIVDRVAPAAVVASEEVFGPVLAVLTFRTDDEALTLANATDYGLCAGVWTNDGPRATWLARELCVGQVFVNAYRVAGTAELPFGGRKRSGFGREKGVAALREYTQVKAVMTAGARVL